MTLGRLEKVALRDIWKTEAQDFSPWLAGEDNLALLSETLGIDLELEAVEQNVGPFRADILCKDTVADKWVLIENQLERTDHTHLGQLMTYAAGLDAVTIVWIAARIADEHRAAMDWLNEITDNHVRFFALEVELWKIGSSVAAPKFNVVSKPNDWSRTANAAKKVVEEGNLTPTRQMQLDYWTQVQQVIAEIDGPVRPVTGSAGSWVAHGIGKTHVSLNMSMNTRENWVRTEIYFSGPWAKSYFAQIYAQKDQIETAMGCVLDWQPLPDKQDARLCIARSVDLSNRADWQQQHQWLAQKANLMHNIIKPLVATLEQRPIVEASSL